MQVQEQGRNCKDMQRVWLEEKTQWEEKGNRNDNVWATLVQRESPTFPAQKYIRKFSKWETIINV